MIQRFGGMNLSSKNPEAMVRFYHDLLGIPILGDISSGFDGTELGFNSNEPRIWIWDTNKWGESNTVTVTLVYHCDDLDKTYEELKAKGIHLEPPFRAVWGGKELNLKDPEGNLLLLLEQ